MTRSGQRRSSRKNRGRISIKFSPKRPDKRSGRKGPRNRRGSGSILMDWRRRQRAKEEQEELDVRNAKTLKKEKEEQEKLDLLNAIDKYGSYMKKTGGKDVDNLRQFLSQSSPSQK